MNKLNIILRAISCANLLLTGGSTLYNANQPAIEVQIVGEDIRNSPEEVSEKTDTATKTETKPEQTKEETPKSETPQQTGPTYVETSPDGPTGHSSATSGIEPAKPAPNPVIKQYNSLADWEADVWELCPSQRPAYTQTGYVSYIPAIGISGLGSPNTPDKAVEILWNNMKTQGLSRLAFGSYGMITNNRTYGNDRWSFYANASDLNVYWQQTFDNENLTMSPEKEAEFNALASQMTAHLKYIDSAYRAKCPNN